MSTLQKELAWESIKLEYLCSKIGLRPLAEKHALQFSTVSKRARRERWHDERERMKHQEPQPAPVPGTVIKTPPRGAQPRQTLPEFVVERYGSDQKCWPLWARPARVLKVTWGVKTPAAKTSSSLAPPADLPPAAAPDGEPPPESPNQPRYK